MDVDPTALIRRVSGRSPTAERTKEKEMSRCVRPPNQCCGDFTAAEHGRSLAPLAG